MPNLVFAGDGFRKWMGVIMSSVCLDPWVVGMNGVGCVEQNMMILGESGIPLIREIVLIICEIWMSWIGMSA